MKKVLFLFLTTFFLFFWKTLVLAQTSPIQVNSSYYGEVITQERYNYAPTIIFDEGVYKMWWCGPNGDGEVIDQIHYATSIDGFHWGNRQIVLGRTHESMGRHVCDPSVVKVNGKYYIYITSDSSEHTREGRDNRIYLATSLDGIQWEMYPRNGKPNQIIRCPLTDGSYCVGQPSVLYKDGKFWLYYSNTRGKSGNDWFVYLKSSNDGINFIDENNAEAVYGQGYGRNSVDVKYNQALGIYFMIHGEINDNKIFWNISEDGLHWLPYDPSRTIATDLNKPYAHNPGLLGSPIGFVENSTVAYYGSSPWGEWDIDASTVTLSRSLISYKNLLQNWGSSPANPKADLNSDGVVNGFDFGKLRKLIP